jgi:hypothetical protein
MDADMRVTASSLRAISAVTVRRSLMISLIVNRETPMLRARSLCVICSGLSTLSSRKRPGVISSAMERGPERRVAEADETDPDRLMDAPLAGNPKRTPDVRVLAAPSAFDPTKRAPTHIQRVFQHRCRNTLAAIFTDPVRATCRGPTSRHCFKAAGGSISQGRGSRVRISLNGVDAVFHRPHPQRENDKGALRSVRRFLREARVVP